MAIDPITTEVVRNRLQSITTEMSAAVVKTAVSPVISEARDFSCILYDGDGRIVASAATVPFHLGVSSYAVDTVRTEFTDIGPGDVFIANDPHHGGGLHPQDVIIMKPVFVGDTLTAWASASGHMIDMGGMTPGSFAPEARERYQEAVMIPPVRLLRRGEEEHGVWALILNNVRLSDKVEMDLRSLIAGVNVAEEKVRVLVAAYGEQAFASVLQTVRERSEMVLRRRIAELPQGVYRARGWAEFNEELFAVVCALSVEEEALHFDYTGSSAQCRYFINSTQAIVLSELIVRVYQILGSDLPFTDGILRPVTVTAPKGTIVNSAPPAPIAAAHMHVGLLATELGETCLKRALACSQSAQRARITAPGGTTGMGLSTWHGLNQHGVADTFLIMDGNAVGAGACMERDGINLTGSNYGGPGLVYPDVEIVEQAYPVLYVYKRLRADSGGGGRQRGGASVDAAIAVHGTDVLTGTTLGMRRYVPTAGLFGGYPGATTRFEVKRHAAVAVDAAAALPATWNDVPGDGDELPSNAANIPLAAGEAFRFAIASGGGLGDPIERVPESVARDVALGYVSPGQAESVYGVVLHDDRVDAAKTDAAREAMRRARLARARSEGAGRRSVSGRVVGTLGPDIEVVDDAGARRARCGRCAAQLAVAPRNWKLGAACAESRIRESEGARLLVGGTPLRGRGVMLREFFCPECAVLLESEIVLDGTPIEEDTAPAFYVTGSPSRGAGAVGGTVRSTDS